MACRANSVAAAANQIRGINQAPRSIRREDACNGIGALPSAVGSEASPAVCKTRDGAATAGGAARRKRDRGTTAVQRGRTGLTAAATNMATMVVENTSRRRSADPAGIRVEGTRLQRNIHTGRALAGRILCNHVRVAAPGSGEGCRADRCQPSVFFHGRTPGEYPEFGSAAPGVSAVGRRPILLLD
jgi:hypothetical protein